MFDFVRKHAKILMALMFLLIIPSFVLFGIDGYNRYHDSSAVVASVAGHDISQDEWDAAHKSEVQRLRAAAPTLDAQWLDSPQARYLALERLVQQRVLAQAAQSNKLLISDDRLRQELQSNPALAALRTEDGKLDMERYRQLVASQGLTPEGFEALVRQELAVRQMASGILNTELVAPSLADVALRAFFERRKIEWIGFSPAEFAAQVKPSDAQLSQFYQDNASLFQTPEQAAIEYVMLDLATLKNNIVIREADLRSHYSQNVARLSGQEERRASHILISVAKDASAADRQKAQSIAQKLLEEVRQAPDKFAETARKNSQDPGSAAQGGDLGYFARGTMVKPFEDAVFAMNKSDISTALVQSEFGYHIIQLTDIKTPKPRSFEELRTEIEADLKNQQAKQQFAAAAEVFTNTVYEQPDSLQPVAEKLRLKIQSATEVRRSPSATQTGVLANPKLLAAIFSPDAINKKHNTEAIEITPDQLISARITQHTAAHTRPLAEVRDAVRDRIIATQAAALAKKAGLAKLALWKDQPSRAPLPQAAVVARDQISALPRQVFTAVLRADTSNLPAIAGVDLGEQGYAIFRINKVEARPTPPAAALKQEYKQYGQWWAQAEDWAYGELLKERFKAHIRAPKPPPSSAGSTAPGNAG